MSFGIYAVGFLIIIIGLGYLAHLMHIPQTYIVAGGIILVGIGITTAVQSTRQRDKS
jgi:small neutral amino acid transporter SnatA (MarC family)